MGDRFVSNHEPGRTTKDRIFLAAAELFSEKGYKGVSMKDIAQKCDIKPASIYNHYRAKEMIMDDLLDYYLDRMERFYQRLSESSANITHTQDLGVILNKLMLAYEPDEKVLMYYLTRIVHHEQFNYTKAAEALIGTGYKKYVNAHILFFDHLSDRGLIHGKANNRFYGEIYARLSLTFGTQFLHPEIEPTIANQTELSNFVNELVQCYERTQTEIDKNE